jgi:hypothetical protein
MIMLNNIKNILVIIFLLCAVSCEEETYEVEYQPGYPNILAGNWEAYDFPNGAFDLESNFDGPYDLVTALDPNSGDSLVVSNIYDTGVRVKARFSGQTIAVTKGKQLEVINDGEFGIRYVSIEGQVFPAEDNDEQDVIVMLIGLYDQFDNQVDSVYTVGFRKTGFENIEDQNFD